MKLNLKWMLVVLPFLAYTACNKDNLLNGKAIHVTINGYNGSGDELEVSIDSTVYDKSKANGAYILKPMTVAGFNTVYHYLTEALHSSVSIKDPATGKVVYQKPLPTTGTKANYNFIYINNQVIDVPLPEVDASTNQLGFYIHYPDSDEALDVSLYRIDAGTGQEYRAYLAKNIIPGTWINLNYTAFEQFDTKNELSSASICFTKAGTTSQWAFNDDESKSKLSANSLTLPVATEKGLVLSYFFTPGTWQLDFSRLFFYPDRTE